MFEIEFFDQYNQYQKKTFKDKKKFISFLKKCEKNEIEVLNFTDPY